MSTVTAAVLLGVVGALAVTSLLVVLIPERSDLVAALRQPRTPLIGSGLAAVPGIVDQATGPRSVWHRARWWAEQRLAAVSWLHTPDDDLRVMGVSRGTFLLSRIGAAAAGLVVGPVYMMVFSVVGLSLPFAVTGLFGIGMAAVAWVILGAAIHDQAQKRRRAMRYALVGFLTLVALHRAANKSMGQALDRAAQSSDTWAYRTIARRMQVAVRGGSNEWAGLQELGAELGIDELSDIADIADLGGNAGASVYSTLMARAQSLSRELQIGEEEEATAASSRLAVPKVLLTVTMAAFLLFPALIRLMS